MTDTAVAAVTLTPAQKSRLDRIEKMIENNRAIDPELRKDPKSFVLALLEACSLSAKLPQNKRRQVQYYQAKRDAIKLALELGCGLALDKDGFGAEVMYLSAPTIGVVSVHTEHPGDGPRPDWREFHWCGIFRQRWAFAALEHAGVRALLAKYTLEKSTTDPNQFEADVRAKVLNARPCDP